MIVIPCQSHDHQDDRLIIVLQGDSLERMQRADPCGFDCHDLQKTLVNPIVLVCYEAETPEFSRLIQAGNLAAVAKYLTRGMEFRPDLGDVDEPPQKLMELN